MSRNRPPGATSIVATLWRQRALVGGLAMREFRVRYAGSVLGAAWTILEPALQFGLYLTVFSLFLGMRFESNGRPGSYGMYLVSGLVPFLALQESLVRAVGLARGQAQLVRHVNVPLEVLLAGSVGAVMGRYGLALLLVTVAAIGMGTIAWTAVGWVVLGVALLLVGVLGAGLIMVPAGAYLPDLVQVVGTGTTVLLFLTPIVYPASVLPARVVPFLAINPLVGLVELFRAGLAGGAVHGPRVALTAAVAVALLAAGAAVFSRRQAAVRDLV
jgi:lipopolysaccharide transport system permease protein